MLIFFVTKFNHQASVTRGFLFLGGWVDLGMFRYISLLLFIGATFWSCDDENDTTILSGLDTIPPSIQILSPLDADILADNTIIDVEAYDNESIHRVEFYIKKFFPICLTCPDSLVYTDFDAPFSFYWDIYDFECGKHTLKAIVYDNSNNSSSALNHYILDQVINIPCDITTSTFSEESIHYNEYLNDEWVLDCLYRDNKMQGIMRSNKGVTITFLNQNSIDGYGGCNYYFGYHSDNNNTQNIGYPRTFEIGGWNKMACTTPECQMEQEQLFLTDLIPKVRAYHIYEEQLVMFDNNGQELLIFHLAMDE